MRMSFLEVLQILRQYWDLGKIGFLFLELIFLKYIYIRWKITGKIAYKEGEKETLIIKKKYSESRVEFGVSLMSCQLPTSGRYKNNAPEICLILYN